MLAQTLRIATPLIFAALGWIFSEKSGVVNIGLEGMMVIGAFFAVYGSYITGSPLMGIIFAVVAGGVLAVNTCIAQYTFACRSSYFRYSYKSFFHSIS